MTETKTEVVRHELVRIELMLMDEAGNFTQPPVEFEAGDLARRDARPDRELWLLADEQLKRWAASGHKRVSYTLYFADEQDYTGMYMLDWRADNDQSLAEWVAQAFQSYLWDHSIRGDAYREFARTHAIPFGEGGERWSKK